MNLIVLLLFLDYVAAATLLHKSIDEIVDYIFIKHRQQFQENVTWQSVDLVISRRRQELCKMSELISTTVALEAELVVELILKSALLRMVCKLIAGNDIFSSSLRSHILKPPADIVSFIRCSDSNQLMRHLLAHISAMRLLFSFFKSSSTSYPDWQKHKLAMTTVLSTMGLMIDLFNKGGRERQITASVMLEQVKSTRLVEQSFRMHYLVPIAFVTSLEEHGIRAPLVPLAEITPTQEPENNPAFYNCWRKANALASSLSWPTWPYILQLSLINDYLKELNELTEKLEATHQRFLPMFIMISMRLLVLEEFIEFMQPETPSALQTLHEILILHQSLYKKGEVLAGEMQARSLKTRIDGDGMVQENEQVGRLVVELFQVPGSVNSPPILGWFSTIESSDIFKLEVFISDNYTDIEGFTSSLRSLVKTVGRLGSTTSIKDIMSVIIAHF